jgi:ribosomal protein S17E
MGKIKSKLVRRTTKRVIETNSNLNSDFEHNKKILMGTIPSHKLRNQIAGLIARVKKREREKESSLKLNE